MERVHVPNEQEIRDIAKLARPHRKTYETQWEQVRNQHVAHTAIVEPNARYEMFQKTRIADMEELLGFLNQLHHALWGMYHHGTRPVIERPVECSVKALVAMKLEELGRNGTPEFIVGETRKCLALFTEAALPKARASIL